MKKLFIFLFIFITFLFVGCDKSSNTKEQSSVSDKTEKQIISKKVYDAKDKPPLPR